MTEPDPWTAFLSWLETVIVPDWSQLVAMLPLWVLVGVTGPIITLLALAWSYHLVTRPRVHLRTVEADAVTAPRDAEGLPVFPANVPYNPRLGLIYPPDRTTCQADGTSLLVRCPVDGTVREAAGQVCRACGTRYVLGAATTPMLVQRTGKPPAGGAAAA